MEESKAVEDKPAAAAAMAAETAKAAVRCKPCPRNSHTTGPIFARVRSSTETALLQPSHNLSHHIGRMFRHSRPSLSRQGTR